MSDEKPGHDDTTGGADGAGPDEKSDLRVVLQFFIVPLALVVVLVLVFFGLQVARDRSPDPRATLRSLQSYDGFLAGVVGDLKRWQSGYDLSLLLRAQDREETRRLLPELVAAFRAAASGPDPRLRRYLALTLGQAADGRAVEALREGMRDPDAPTRLYSAWALMRTGDAEGLPELRTAAGDADDAVRKMAVFALGEMGDREALPLLREALADPRRDVGWNAALALARLGDRSGAPALRELLEAAAAGTSDDPDGDAARERVLNAIRGLSLLEDPEAIATLRRVAEASPDPVVRETARRALAAFEAGGAAGGR